MLTLSDILGRLHPTLAVSAFSGERPFVLMLSSSEDHCFVNYEGLRNTLF